MENGQNVRFKKISVGINMNVKHNSTNWHTHILYIRFRLYKIKRSIIQSYKCRKLQMLIHSILIEKIINYICFFMFSSCALHAHFVYSEKWYWILSRLTMSVTGAPEWNELSTLSQQWISIDWLICYWTMYN